MSATNSPHKHDKQQENDPDNNEAVEKSCQKRNKRVQNYALKEELGHGTFGSVRLAVHLISGESVAIKVLEKKQIKCEDDFTRIIREIKVLKLLNNKNIVKLLEVIDTPQRIYLVTELVHGGELFNYVINHQRLDEKEACHIFRQICAAVYYCHSRKVCHRDLKLENILINENREIKIIDFGLSNVLQKDYYLKTACGSPSYAAPEMLSQKKYNGPMIDIWALGVILFAMLAGYLPFDDDDLQKLYKKIISGVFRIPAFISASAGDLISKILVTDPNKRISLKEITQHPWYVETLSEPPPPLDDVDAPSKIDFRTVYSMVKTIQDWSPEQIVKALTTNRHNQITATYYLLGERKKNANAKDPSKSSLQWNYEEQAKYAKYMGFELYEDGTAVLNAG